MKRFALLVLGVSLGLSIYAFIQSLPRKPRPAVPETGRVRTVASLSDEMTSSRTNAIVVAAREVSPAVVSITVTQTRVVSSPFWSPFGGDDPFNWFFRDFAPPREYRQQVKAMGSGLILSSDGYVVTNAHVAEDATQITVTLPDGKQHDGELVGVSNVHDLALVKINGRDLPYARLGNSDDAIIGEWAIALGNPFGYLLEDTKPTVTVGVISATKRSIRAGRTEGREYKNMIQTDAAINPGNSGGPLVNANGEVIGINTFIFTSSGGSEGVGFALPINEVKRFVAEARKTEREAGNEPGPERISTGIGATVSDINRTLKRKYKLSVDSGAVVVEVGSGSIAEAANLEEGDVILAVAGRKVKGAEDFRAKAAAVGRSLDMLILRQGSQIRMIYRY